MFIGETGLSRVIRRTLEVMKEVGSDDPAAVRRQGAIDLPTVQRYLNYWYSSSLDLFGAENSSNAASAFANAIKGRPDEGQFADHDCAEARVEIEVPDGASVKTESIGLRNAMNEVTRGAYVKDCEIGVKRWNALIRKAGVAFELKLPSTRFRRSIGAWANVPTDPLGNIISAEAYAHALPEWVPSEADRAFVAGLMRRAVEPGKIAAWIAPPERGINNLPIDYEYVRLN